MSFRMFGSKVSPKKYLSTVATEGVDLHFGQSAEDIILLRIFKKRREGFYIDVGAFHPRRYSNTYVLHHFYDWSGINIDASSETIALFDQERPNDINVHTAVGNKEEQRTFWKFNYPARNTISKRNLQRQLLKKDAEVTGEEIIRVRPLADIISEYLPKGRTVDLLNIDVEGLDLEVLESNDWLKYRPKVVLIEDYDLKAKGIENSEIYRFMVNQGYRFSSHNFDTSLYIDLSFIDAEGDLVDTSDGSIKTSDKKEILKETRNRLDTLIKAQIDVKKLNGTLEAIQNELNDDSVISELQSATEERQEMQLKLSYIETKIKPIIKELEEQRELNNELNSQIKKFIRDQQLRDRLWIAENQLKESSENLSNREKSNRKLINQKNELINEIEKTKEKNSVSLSNLTRYNRIYKEVMKSRSWRYTAFARNIGRSFRSFFGIKKGVQNGR